MENILKEVRLNALKGYLTSRQKDVIFENYKKAVEAEDEASASDLARQYRDCLLAECDFWDNVSYRSRKSAEKVEAWDNYRNALRDIPEQTGFPFDIDFPLSPDQGEEVTS